MASSPAPQHQAYSYKVCGCKLSGQPPRLSGRQQHDVRRVAGAQPDAAVSPFHFFEPETEVSHINQRILPSIVSLSRHAAIHARVAHLWTAAASLASFLATSLEGRFPAPPRAPPARRRLVRKHSTCVLGRCSRCGRRARARANWWQRTLAFSLSGIDGGLQRAARSLAATGRCLPALELSAPAFHRVPSAWTTAWRYWLTRAAISGLADLDIAGRLAPLRASSDATLPAL